MSEVAIERAVDIGPYLAPLRPRGSGNVRESGMRVRSDGPTRIVVDHGRLGHYEIELTGVRWPSSLPEGERPSLAYSTWTVEEDKHGWQLSLHQRSLLGGMSARVRAAGIIVHVHTPMNVPMGACAACGGTRVRVRLPLSMEMDVVGEDALSWDGAGLFENCLVDAVCVGCGAEHPSAGPFGRGLEWSVNGRRFARYRADGTGTPRRSQVADVLPLADVLPGRAS